MENRQTIWSMNTLRLRFVSHSQHSQHITHVMCAELHTYLILLRNTYKREVFTLHI